MAVNDPPQGRWFLQVCCRKNGNPIDAGAAATRSLTRFTPYRAPPSVFHMTEEIMTVEQHIEKLRAELRCITDPVELRQIEAELQMALSKAAELEATIDPWPDCSSAMEGGPASLGDGFGPLDRERV